MGQASPFRRPSTAPLARTGAGPRVAWPGAERTENTMTPCPCGGADYRHCCGPLVDDGVPARTAEQLMRSRYTAFALERPDHLWRTWHPRTRPETVEVGGTKWTGLTVLEVVAGVDDDDGGVVEFEARFTDVDGPGIMRERSEFRRRGGRWVYLDGA